MRKLSSLVIILFLILILFGCSDTSYPQTTSHSAVIYTDSEKIDTESFTIEFSKPSCYGIDKSYLLNVHFTITNKEYKTKSYTISNAKIIKESTSAKYEVRVETNFSVQAEMSKGITFSAGIPSDITSDNYKLSFKINSFNITFFLYETPDAFRTEHTVNYYIDNQLVYSTIIKDNRPIGSLYIYETADHLNHCSSWYQKGTNVAISPSSLITQDTDLYGTITSNFNWSGITSDVYSYIMKVNYVPSDGILRIPETYQHKDIAISLYAIKDIKVSKIYVPKTVRVIFNGNFAGIGNATIYYEGSKSEWDASFYYSGDIYSKNVVYNTKYA